MSEQRIPNMRGIMSARTKPLTVVEASEVIATTEVSKFTLPPAKGDCVMVDADNAADLVRLLREEAKII
jgi:electron transfer flavoprotein beta subunit